MARPGPIEVRFPMQEVLDWSLDKRLCHALVDFAFEQFPQSLPFGEEWDDTNYGDIRWDDEGFVVTLYPI